LITLGLDTTGQWCSAALVDRAHILSSKSERIGRGHAERLAPMVDELFKAVKIGPTQIDRIAVCTGPGSFTGLRVAIAFARSFALPRKTPVIGISALRGLAAEVDPRQSSKVASVINVKRGEICWAGYDRGQETTSPTTLSIEEARFQVKSFNPDIITGDGAELIGAVSSGHDHVLAPVMAWLSQDLEPALFPPEPVYSRGPDAKLPGGKSL